MHIHLYMSIKWAIGFLGSANRRMLFGNGSMTNFKLGLYVIPSCPPCGTYPCHHQWHMSLIVLVGYSSKEVVKATSLSPSLIKLVTSPPIVRHYSLSQTCHLLVAPWSSLPLWYSSPRHVPLAAHLLGALYLLALHLLVAPHLPFTSLEFPCLLQGISPSRHVDSKIWHLQRIVTTKEAPLALNISSTHIALSQE